MRASFWILCLALSVLLQSCTAIGAGVSHHVARRSQAKARTSGAQTQERPPTPGDALTLTFADGSVVYGAFVSMRGDSIGTDVGTFALADLDTVEQPWSRTPAAVPIVLGVSIDVWLLVVAVGALREFNRAF